MKYVGSKRLIANDIIPIIQGYIDASGYDTYIEPFVGGANVIDKIQCKYRLGYDCNKYVIALLNYVRDGGELPKKITREQHNKVRDNKDEYDEWYVGYVGILCSFRARWFGGWSGETWTDGDTVRHFITESNNCLERQRHKLKGIEFIHSDYKDVLLNNKDKIIYCDPPYAGTTDYETKFDNNEFWAIVRQACNDNVIIISEEYAPLDFKCIWQKQVKRPFDVTKTVTERMFVHETETLEPLNQQMRLELQKEEN